jgi:endonuclease/exonuclease/phosphatase family protein
VRILQLNVWARSGPYATRAGLLRAEVARLTPDLIALQEVDDGPGDGNQAEELFGPLGYTVEYERRDGEYRADPGIAVASRLPLTGRHILELPHGSPFTWRPRVAVRSARVVLRGDAQAAPSDHWGCWPTWTSTASRWVAAADWRRGTRRPGCCGRTSRDGELQGVRRRSGARAWRVTS